MKKLIYALSALLLAVSLSSCDTEIKNAGSKDLIGTWDLVSTTVVLGDGTETTTKSTNGDYIVIAQDSYTSVSGNRETKSSFSFNPPHLIIGGDNLYDLVTLTRKEMVLKATLYIPILQREVRYTYQRR